MHASAQMEETGEDYKVENRIFITNQVKVQNSNGQPTKLLKIPLSLLEYEKIIKLWTFCLRREQRRKILWAKDFDSSSYICQ